MKKLTFAERREKEIARLLEEAKTNPTKADKYTEAETALFARVMAFSMQEDENYTIESISYDSKRHNFKIEFAEDYPSNRYVYGMKTLRLSARGLAHIFASHNEHDKAFMIESYLDCYEIAERYPEAY